MVNKKSILTLSATGLLIFSLLTVFFRVAPQANACTGTATRVATATWIQSTLAENCSTQTFSAHTSNTRGGGTLTYVETNLWHGPNIGGGWTEHYPNSFATFSHPYDSRGQASESWLKWSDLNAAYAMTAFYGLL